MDCDARNGNRSSRRKKDGGVERRAIGLFVTVTADGLLTALDTGPKQVNRGGMDLGDSNDDECKCKLLVDMYTTTSEPAKLEDAFRKRLSRVLW